MLLDITYKNLKVLFLSVIECYNMTLEPCLDWSVLNACQIMRSVKGVVYFSFQEKIKKAFTAQRFVHIKIGT